MKPLRFVSIASLVACLVACGDPPPSGLDAGGDSGTGPGRDAGPDTGPTIGRGTCASPIDLGVFGDPIAAPAVGRRYVGDDTSAPAGAMSGLPNGSCAGTAATHEVVFTYTMQSRAGLRATTVGDPATQIDTYVWMLSGCGADAHEYACNLTSDDAIAAGTTVYIVVAGDAFGTSSGSFGLSVTEIPAHAANETCSGPDDIYCVDGYSCWYGAGESMAHCRPQGAATFACRLQMPYCDTGLSCTEDPPAYGRSGSCQPSVATGAPCTIASSACDPGVSCRLDEGSATMGHCLVDGAEYGRCRLGASACDAGLTCSETSPTAAQRGTCQMPVAPGAACTERHGLCAAGGVCLQDSFVAPERHCLADGASFGQCRLAPPFCDAGLRCSYGVPLPGLRGTCQPPVPTGAPCADWHDVCEDAAAFCIHDPSSAPAGTCVVAGTRGGECRTSAPACDAGLTCDGRLCR